MQWKRVMISFLLILGLMCGIANAESITDILVDSRTAQSFTDEAVPEEDLLLILQAGLAATSAINQQPWYFVAVSNQDMIAEIQGSGGSLGGGAPAGGAAPQGDFGQSEGGTAAPQGGFG